MALQRHHFVKGYLTTDEDAHYIRVEESYDGQKIEIFVGDSEFDNECTCDCGCTPADHFGVALSREQIKELLFCLNQLHFIDKE